MHYFALVFIPAEGAVDKHVERLMKPYLEDGNEGWWDWYQIGGRWTGWLTGYDPTKDPGNIKTCWLCDGTGTRRDMVVANGCNGCRGTGRMLEWATNWKRHDGDVQPVARVADMLGDRTPFALVDETGAAHRDDVGEDEPWRKELRAYLDRNRDGRVVVVDYHS